MHRCLQPHRLPFHQVQITDRVGWGNMEWEVFLTILHMFSHGNQPQNLLILSNVISTCFTIVFPGLECQGLAKAHISCQLLTLTKLTQSFVLINLWYWNTHCNDAVHYNSTFCTSIVHRNLDGVKRNKCLLQFSTTVCNHCLSGTAYYTTCEQSKRLRYLCLTLTVPVTAIDALRHFETG